MTGQQNADEEYYEVKQWAPIVSHDDSYARETAGYGERYKTAEHAARNAPWMKTAEEREEIKRKELEDLRLQVQEQVEEMIKVVDPSKTLLPSVVDASELRAAVLADIRKTQRYRQLPCYVVFLIMVVTLLFIQTYHDQRSAYFTIEEVSSILAEKDFLEVSEWDHWWKWLDKAATGGADLVPTVAQPTPGVGPGLPLGFLLVRQWRVDNVTCSRRWELQTRALSSAARGLIGSAPCYPNWNPSDSSSTPFGKDPDLPFRPDSHDEFALNSPDVVGKRSVYDSSLAYTVKLRFNEGTTMSQQIATLNSRGYVDDSTAAVAVDVIGFMQSRQQFFISRFLLESTVSGTLVPSAFERLFMGFGWKGDRSHMTFLIDIASLGYLVWLVWSTVKGAVFDLSVSQSVVSSIQFWRIFDIAFIAVCLASFYFRFILWHDGELEDDPHLIEEHAKDYGGGDNGADLFMWHFLHRLAEVYDNSLLWYGWMVLMAWIRTLVFLQHSERLGLVSGTMMSMSSTFIVLAALFLLVLTGFIMAGVLLYGHDLEAFSTFGKSLSVLSRFIFTQEMSCDKDGACLPYNELNKIYRYSPAFVYLVMVLGFIIILNVLIALVIVKLYAVQEGSRTGGVYDWSPKALWEDIIKASRRMNPDWLSHTFESLMQRFFYRKNKEAEELERQRQIGVIGDAVAAGDLKEGDRVVVRNSEEEKWKKAVVTDVVALENPMVVLRMEESKELKLASEWTDLRREGGLPFEIRNVGWKRTDFDEAAHLKVMRKLDGYPRGYVMGKPDWLDITKDHIPPPVAMKLFDMASENEKTTRNMGVRFSRQLVQRINRMETWLGGREGNLRRVPFLALQEAHDFAKTLGPMANLLIPHYQRTADSLHQLQHAMQVDFDDYNTHVAQHFGRVAELQTEVLAPTIEEISMQQAVSQTDLRTLAHH